MSSNQLPNLENLFGQTSSCQCEECGSIDGPAAYLVDILSSILETNIYAADDQNQPIITPQGHPVYGIDILRGPDPGLRRPDIEHLELTCKNTNTPLPYIDLVNETLENAIAPQKSFPQTTGTAEELAANPEHVNDGAYNDPKNAYNPKTLAGAVYPWTLPFNLAAQSAGVYLAHLGVTRSQLMAVFRQRTEPWDKNSIAVLLDAGIAAESLQLTNLEWQVITAGLNLKNPVRVATIGPITLSGLQTIDGVNLAGNDRVLVKDQPAAAGAANGIYVVAAGAWSRSDDANLGVQSGLLVRVSEGAQNGSTRWVLTTTGEIFVGTTKLTFAKSSVAGDSDAGPRKNAWEYWYSADPKNWPPADLSKVSVFLKQSGLSYTELLELFGTNFINPDQQSPYVVQFADDQCNLDTATLVPPLTGDALSRIHRFVRLRRKLGWSARELDKTIAALAPGDLTDDFLLRVSHIQRLGADLQVPIVNMLSWWADIDVDGRESLYLNLFQNKTVLNPVDPAFRLSYSVQLGTLPNGVTLPNEISFSAGQLSFVGAMTDDERRTLLDLDKSADPKYAAAIDRIFEMIAWGGTDLADTGRKISDRTVVDTVLGALRISASDLSLLLTGEVADKLNVTNLSHLYRIVSFSNALRLSIPDFLSVKVLTAIEPFDTQHTEETLRFANEVQKLRASGFTIPELNYLLRPEFSLLAGIAPSGQSVVLVLEEIRDGIQKISDDNRAIADPTGDLTRKKLAIVLPADQVEDGFAIVSGSSTKSAGDQQSFVEANFKFVDPAQFPQFELQLLWDPNRKDSNGKPSPGPNLTGSADRFEYTLALLLSYLRRTLSQSLVLQKLASALKLDAATTTKLLTGGETQSGAIQAGTGPSKAALTDFLPSDDQDLADWSHALDQFAADPETFLADPIALIQNPRLRYQVGSFTLLYKTALILSRLRVTFEELPWVLKYGIKGWSGWLDPNALPVKTNKLSMAYPYAAWQRLADLAALRNALPPGALFNIIKLASRGQTNELNSFFNDRLGWRIEDTQPILNLQAADYQNEQAVLLLKKAFDLIRRLGASAGKIFEWTGAVVTTSNSDDIKSALKAKYDNDQWLGIAKPLQDALREKRRAALVSFLTGSGIVVNNKPFTFSNSNELFDYFLVDVEMSPCQMTSRIKQAIGSVQLFVQRCLMQLEKYPDPNDAGRFLNVHIDSKAAGWWRQWMSNFRVWQANLQVFLHPENWAEPGLRHDKTPFFKDLENQLLQGNITSDSAEDAFRAYLQKLDQVARLEIVGLHHEIEKDDRDKVIVDTLHVFGRTAGMSPIYFYRTRQQGGNASYWSAWKKVEVDIHSDHHLIFAVWNRRPHILWPIFTTKSPDPKPSDIQSSTAPEKYLSIQLAWSEYKNDKWSPKNLSTGSLTLISLANVTETRVLDETQYVFKATVDQDTGDLVVRCMYNDPEERQYGYTVIGNNGEDLGIQNEFSKLGVEEGVFRFKTCGGEPVLQTLGLVLKGNVISEVFHRASDGDELMFVPDPLLLPAGTRLDGMMMIAQDDAVEFSMPAGHNVKDQLAETILRTIPSPFRLLYPQEQVNQFYSQDAFFYQDDNRIFFVNSIVNDNWQDDSQVSLGWSIQDAPFKQPENMMQFGKMV